MITGEYLEIKEMLSMKHTIGFEINKLRTKKGKKVFQFTRNYFLTSEGTSDYVIFEGLVSRGYVGRRKNLLTDGIVFYITDRGFELMSRFLGAEIVKSE